MSGDVPSAAHAVRHDLLDDIEIDDSVADNFPSGSKVVSAIPHGASFWTRTARVTIKLANGSTQFFFLKIGKDDFSRDMLRSEYDGVNALYRIVPELVPRPIAWGAYVSKPDTFFFLADFIPMLEELPDPELFCTMLARLHRDSIPLSSNGKFGFHVTTYSGTMPQDVTWCDTWEESYARALRSFAEQESKAQGLSEEMEQLYPKLFDQVIPRLLRPLSAEGRAIKPVLVHGDLWYGNMAINAETGAPVTFDPAVIWAHNEYELVTFNIPRYRIGPEFLREYHKHFPISSPEEDYEDRNRLYSIHCHFCASTLYPTSSKFRDMAIQDIKYLTDKYAGEVRDPS